MLQSEYPDPLDLAEGVHAATIIRGEPLVNASGSSRAENAGDDLAVLFEFPHGVARDASSLARFGVKGPGVTDWLQAAGCAIPPRINQAVPSGGCRVVRLGAGEYWVVAETPDANAAIAELRAKFAATPPAGTGNLVLPRGASHVHLRLEGAGARALLARVCALDLRPQTVSVGEVMQTSMAHITVVMHVNDNAFDLWCEATFAEYFVDTLRAIAERLSAS